MSSNLDFPPPVLQPGQRPGERYVNGEIYVFNADLLNAYLADRCVAEAPADLSDVAWGDLAGLLYCYLNRRERHPYDAANAAFGTRVCDERARRPEYAAFRKGCA